MDKKTFDRFSMLLYWDNFAAASELSGIGTYDLQELARGIRLVLRAHYQGKMDESEYAQETAMAILALVRPRWIKLNVSD